MTFTTIILVTLAIEAMLYCAHRLTR